MNIIFVTDNLESIVKYRSKLINILSLEYQTFYLNVFSFAFLVNIFLNKKKIFVSSNGLCNVIILLLPIYKVLIFNGFGRYEKSKFVRIFILIILKKFKKSTASVQSYRDYRYFRLHGARRINWVPGSGGTKRPINGRPEHSIIVSRKEKINYLHEISGIHKNFANVAVVGVENYSEIALKYKNIKFLGIRSQDDIFDNAKLMLQLNGYGEGIPHSLVDAILSNLDISISKRVWIKSGFYKMTKHRPTTWMSNNNFYFLENGSVIKEELSSIVNIDAINKRYTREIRQTITEIE